MPGVMERVAVVTGAGHGLGRAIAILSSAAGCARGAGRHRSGGTRGHRDDDRRAGGAAITVTSDLTEEAPAAQLVERAVERFGRVDVLVNNYITGHTLAVTGGR